jgi:hypothetical protein
MSPGDCFLNHRRNQSQGGEVAPSGARRVAISHWQERDSLRRAGGGQLLNLAVGQCKFRD